MGKKFTSFRVNLDGLEEREDWYTIVTQYNYEQKVANDIKKIIEEKQLEGYLFDAFSCIQEVEYNMVNKKGIVKVKTRNEKVLPNYVFVKAKMNVNVWSTLTNITGVSAILCVAETPMSTPESKINEMKKLLKIA